MTKIRIERCEYPWIINLDRGRMITLKWRSEMLAWLAQNIARGGYRIEDEMNSTIILRFREQGDAMLFKVRFEGAA